MTKFNTSIGQKPHSCTCQAVYNQLHHEWDHTSECSWTPELEIEFLATSYKERAEEQERALIERVKFAVKRGKSHTISSKLLKKYAPETYA